MRKRQELKDKLAKIDTKYGAVFKNLAAEDRSITNEASSISVEFDDFFIALESTGDCFIDKETGDVVHLPDSFEDLDDAFSEERSRVEADETKFVMIDPFPSNVAFSIREEFANQLPDEEEAKALLLDALRKSRPFRRFKDVLDEFLDVRAKWFTFKDKEMEYWAAWWLRKNSVEANIVRKPR